MSFFDIGDEMISIRKYNDNDIEEMAQIWNEVVNDAVAFPQIEPLGDDAKEFCASQSYCGVAQNDETGEIVGMYILHPNNVGRCAHISNASFAVSSKCRGEHIGEKLVCDCLENAKALGFKIMQFNAVVSTNVHARHLYERLGFNKLGTIPAGFMLKDGEYEDICVYYKTL